MADLRERFRGLDQLPVPDLRSEIRGRRPSRSPPGPPWRRLGAAAAALVVAAGGLVLASRAFLGDRGDRPSRPGDSLPSPSERAATVAITALIETGLVEGVGLVPYERGPETEDAFRLVQPYDYGGIFPSGEGWIAAFCVSSSIDQGCDREVAESFLTISPEGDDLVVTRVSGAFTEEQRDRLLGYREPAEPSPAQRIYGPVSIVDRPQREGQMVVGLFHWTGAIPSDLGALCRTEVLDQQGRLVYSREFPSQPPETERDRDGSFLLELPKDVMASGARVACEEWLPIQIVPEGERHVLASGTVEAGEHAGETWRLVVWRGQNVDDPERFEQWRLNAEGADLYCWGLDGPWIAVRYGQRVPQGGCTALTADYQPERIGGRTVGSIAGEGSNVVVGEVSTEVSSLELRLEDGEVIVVDLRDPPPELGIPRRFFIEFLPSGARGQMVALDAGGSVLAREPLRGGGSA